MKNILFIHLLCISFIATHAQDLNSIDSLLKEGVYLHDQGEYDAAILKYEEALALDSDNITVLAEKAFSLLSLKDYSNSIKVCEQAIKVNPE